MAEITAGMVKELREKTDAPMMECKKALSEAGGDMAKAEEILRVKLGSKASKAASRVTAEGIVSIHVEGAHAAMVEVNCETDFVAKNDDFLAFSRDVTKLVCAGGIADVGSLSAFLAGLLNPCALPWWARLARTSVFADSFVWPQKASSSPIFTAAQKLVCS